MDTINHLIDGFAIALTLTNILAALAGAVLGTAVGVIPGMAPSAWIALLLPVAVVLPPETGLIVLVGIYFGAQYGDSMAAILLNVPSEAPAIVVARDGFKMTQAGRAGPALSLAAIGAFIGQIVGLIGLAFLAPVISTFALSFGPPEFFAIAVFGALVLSRLGGSMWKGIAAFAIGMLLATIGQDPMSGTTRLTFGLFDLGQGIEMVAVAIGLFGVTQLLEMVIKTDKQHPTPPLKLRQLMPSRAERRQAAPAIARGAVSGFILGCLPGPALTLATFLSYRIERWRDRGPVRVGSGSPAAVAGPKSADDASVGGTLAPLTALGLPFTPATVVLYAGLLLLGLQPGPLFIPQHPDVFWGLVAGMFIASLMLLTLNLPFVGIWVRLLKIPRPFLTGGMLILMAIGSYALRNSLFDVLITFAAGFVGVVMLRHGFDRALLILGMILGPVMEPALRRSLTITHGDPSIFVTRPISGAILGLTAVIVLTPLLRRLIQKLRKRGDTPDNEPSDNPTEIPDTETEGSRQPEEHPVADRNENSPILPRQNKVP